MSLGHGASIVKNNLVVSIDSINNKLLYPTNTNLLHNKIWSLGVDSAQFYSRNGAIGENERILDYTPFNNQDVIWQSPSNDLTSNDDGGWNSARFPIDNTKKYRFSVWIRKKDIVGDGRAYLGLYGYNNTNTNIGVYNRSNNTILNTNFYFTSRRFDNTDLNPKPVVNEWVLFVGHVHPTNTSSGSSEADTGVWKLDGTKIASAGDCIWHPDTVTSAHRSYQYYSTSTTEKQQWWDPRVDLIDGTEPSLNDLLTNNIEPQNLDLTQTCKVRCPFNIRTVGNGYQFSTNTLYNETQNLSIDASDLDFSTEQTIILVLKPTSFYQRTNPYDQEYFGYGTITQETSKTYAYYYGPGTSSSTYSSFETGFTVDTNETAFIAFTRDTSNIKSYKNGVFDRSGTNAYPTTGVTSINKTIKIGYGYTGYGFIGNIYSVFLYDRALTAQEIRQNFNALRGRYGI